MQQQSTSLYPPLQVRAGVLVVDGYGIAIRVLNRAKCAKLAVQHAQRNAEAVHD
ncbi:MAG TPA: hypothetical protein VIX83_07625 [Candidatus Cybelea sp.]